MSTTPQITKQWLKTSAPSVTTTFPARQSRIPASVQYARSISALPKSIRPRKPELASATRTRAEWDSRDYREAYMEAAIEQGVAWQIRINRMKRGLTQEDLATLLNTKQSAISRLEDAEYGKYNLETLIDVAKAFDCALLVKFISYAQLAAEADRLSEDDQYASQYSP